MFKVSRFIAARLRFVFIFLLGGVLSLPVHGQAGQLQGIVSGTVTDTTGAAIVDAEVTLASPDKTVVHDVASGRDGGFRIAGLPSGSYAVKITAPGFTSYGNDSVVVAVGRDAHLEAVLPLAKASQQVTVQGQAQTLDTSQTSPVTNIDRDRIEELPIPSRNYLSFTLLAPSLGTANPAYGRRPPGVSEGGFSAAGLRPSSNALYIDGADDNDEYTGLSRTELSPEAISDFQVANHGYAAQSGGAAGGSVDVETRSGANVQHGDAFLFVQNGTLNGTPALELVPHKPDDDRLRAGLSTGGPLRRDKFFYYMAAEQEHARGEDANDFSPQLAAAVDSSVASAGPLQGFALQQGFFPTTDEETEFSSRMDRTFHASSLMLRYALTNNRSVNDAFNTDDISDLSARGSAFYDDNSSNGAWSLTPSPSLFNQLTFEVSQRRAVLRTGTSSGPGIVVAGVAQFGTPYTGNSRRYETHVDLADSAIRQYGKHLVQAGVSFSHVDLRSADLDGFGGLYVFPTLSALANSEPDFYTQSFGNPNTNFGELRSAAFVQDHWAPVKSLAVDYGLRYEDNRLPSSFPQHAINLSPRLGFAFSPDKRWVIRGGFGIFYDRYLLSTLNRIRELDGVHGQQQIAEGASAAALYRSVVLHSAPIAGIAPSIWQAERDLANPYSEAASFGIERSLPAQWALSAEYRFARGVKLGRTINSNLAMPVQLTLANAASLGITAPTPQQLSRFVFPQTRLNPSYDAISQFQTEASSNYSGATITINRQFNEEFELMAGYTYSKTLDDASYDTEQPQNPYALGSERSLSLQDQRHRFVVSGLWVLGPDLDGPQDAGKAGSTNPFVKALYGLEFAPIVSVDSGFHDNPLTGVDSNREHIYPFAARPLAYSRNNLRTPVNVHADLRILKMVPIWRGHLDIVAESFNLLNKQNVDLLNPVYGTGLSAEGGFAKPIQVADPRRIQFSLDFEY